MRYYQDEPLLTRYDPAAIAAERPPVAAVGRELLRRHLPRGGMDLIEGFADKAPMYLMAERLGVPRDMAPQMRDWAREARLLLDPALADTSQRSQWITYLGHGVTY